MKTVLLFSRCELVHLYGRLDQYFNKEYTVIHVAYSKKEENILKNKYKIKKVINFHDEIELLITNYSYDLELIGKIDRLFISTSNSRFNLNSAIQYDRTFQFLSYEECLKYSQVYFLFWNNIISINDVSFFIHEPTSLFFNHIAAAICSNKKAKYVTAIQVYGENKVNFLIASGDSGKIDEIEFSEYKDLSQFDIERVTRFINNFQKDEITFFSQYEKKRESFFSLLLISLKAIIRYIFNKSKFFSGRIKLNSPLSLYNFKKEKLCSKLYKIWSFYFTLGFDDFDIEKVYYYYPIHMEPEAVVLYWGDGIYRNQVKLIENIAAQLPPNVYLFVKDHPHAGIYRDTNDYKKIKSIPNVKLLNPNIHGKSIISKSRGVITISGTSGFEAILLGKSVFVFGNTFYNACKTVHRIKHIRELREVLYSTYNKESINKEATYEYLISYLKAVHPGFTDYFLNYSEISFIDNASNSKTVAEGFLKYFSNIEKTLNRT